jgi:hypothetical protein
VLEVPLPCELLVPFELVLLVVGAAAVLPELPVTAPLVEVPLTCELAVPDKLVLVVV